MLSSKIILNTGNYILGICKREHIVSIQASPSNDSKLSFLEHRLSYQSK